MLVIALFWLNVAFDFLRGLECVFTHLYSNAVHVAHF